MQWTSRATAIALGSAALVGFVRPAAGTGSIATLGAEIDSGAATVRGRVTINPCAPLVPAPVRAAPVPPAPMGAPSGTIADFPGAGSGTTAFVASTDQSLAAGTYDFTSVTIDAGVTVTCTGAVVLRTSGDVRISGAVRSTAAGASIRFVCGGDLTFAGGASDAPAVTTSGAAAPVTLDVNGALSSSIASPARGTISAAHGDVVLVARDEVQGVSLGRVDVAAAAGALDVRAAGTLDLRDVTATTSDAPVDLRSYRGDIDLRGAQISSGAALRAEASLALVSDASALDAAGTIDLAAYDGRLTLSGGTVELRPGATGDVVLRSDEHAFLTGCSVRHRGTGDLRVESQTADVTLRDASLTQEGAGDVALREGSMVLVYGASAVDAAAGDVLFHGLHVEVEGRTTVSAARGTIEVRSANAVVFRPAPGAGADRPDLSAARIDVHGAQSFSRIDVDDAVAGSGGMSLLLGSRPGSTSTAVLRGRFLSAGPLSVQTTSAPVLDLAGADLRTARAGSSGPSPPVTIESFVAGGGEIDLDGATVRSGAATGSVSGAVTVAVRVAGGTDDGTEEPPVEVVDGGIVARVVRATPTGRPAGEARVRVSGVLDTGALPVDLAGPAEWTVGRDVRTVDLARDRSGSLRFGNPALSVRMRPARNGASRVPFRLTWRGDVSAFLDADATGQLDLRLRAATLEAAASVRLERGLYRLGRRAPSLLVPRVAPLSVRARLAEGPRDRVDLRLAFVTDGPPPEAPGDAALTLGPSLAVNVPAAAFTVAEPGLFVARRPSPGIASLVIDWQRGAVRLVARNVEFGSFPGTDPVSLDASLRLDSETRFVRLRVGRRGGSLVY